VARRRPTPEQLGKLRDYYRSRSPSNANDHKAAAIVASVSPAIAARAWSRGWPGIEPIEHDLARERALAQQDPAVLQSERLARAALAAAAGLYKSVLRLSAVAESLTNRLDALVVSGELSQLGSGDALAHLKAIARVMRDATMITATAVETHKLVAGEATSIVAHIDHAPTQPLDLDVAKAEVEATMRAIRREQAKKQLADQPSDDGEAGTVH
jgi:hypothetical protein